MTTRATKPTEISAGAPIRTWFSFRSPYAYLGVHKALKMSLPLQLIATWPTGEVGSTSSPEKMSYLIEDCLRLFAEEGLSFAPPIDVKDWRRPHAAFQAAKNAGLGSAFVLRAYQARWSESKDLSSADVIGEIAESIGFDAKSAIDAMDNPVLHAQMMATREEYEKDEVIGVPFFVYEGQRFWGQDRLDALVQHVMKSHRAVP